MGRRREWKRKSDKPHTLHDHTNCANCFAVSPILYLYIFNEYTHPICAKYLIYIRFAHVKLINTYEIDDGGRIGKWINVWVILMSTNGSGLFTCSQIILTHFINSLFVQNRSRTTFVHGHVYCAFVSRKLKWRSTWFFRCKFEVWFLK